MFAKIASPKKINNALYYNEHKVEEKKAECIWAENFLKDHDQLTIGDKIERFRQRSSLNDELVDNGFHISLNFGMGEKIDNEKMVTIATRYMEAMRLEELPYIIYRHNDAGHTHCHIVCTKIDEHGYGVFLGPPDFRYSNKVTKSLEEEFSLERNRKTPIEELEQFKVHHAQKVVHGEPDFKRKVSDVLNTVVDHYNYSNLDELNAILRQYNVKANPGNEHSRLRELKGLLYHRLDDEGNKTGVPLKASSFELKPTLPHLEERFTINQSLQREAYRSQLQTAIEWSFAGTTPDWSEFVNSLEKDGISVEITRPARDGPERIFFIDHVEKYVFESEALGSHYSLAALRERCALEAGLHIEEFQKQRLKLHL